MKKAHLRIKKEDICAYCGGYKWDNPSKHIAEIAAFLQNQIRDLQKLLKKNNE